MKRFVALFRASETPGGSTIPPTLSLLVPVWIAFIPLSTALALYFRSGAPVELNALALGVSLINDWQNSWRWRDGWRAGRYEVVAELFESWQASIDPREWLMRELYFGDPGNPHLQDLFGPEDPPHAEAK